MVSVFLKVFICLILLYVHILNSQLLNICYAVNGDTSDFLPNNTLSFGPGSWCPTISNDCVWLINRQQVTAIYSVMNGEDLRFEIDYRIDVPYSFNDYTRIYYNCDGIERFLFEVSIFRSNANINTTYYGRNNPYFLPKIYCDNATSIRIRIQQYTPFSQLKYFNFENACIYGFIGTASPSGTPTMTPSLPTIVPTTGTPTIPTSEPTLEPSMEPTSETVAPSPKPSASPLRDPQLTRTVICGDGVSGSITPFETHYYKLVNIPGTTTSIQLNSCGSFFDTVIQVFDDQYNFIYECDDCGNCGTRTILEFTSIEGFIPGIDYIIGIKGYHSSSGFYRLNFNCNFPPTTASPTRTTISPTISPMFNQTKFVQILRSRGSATTSVCFDVDQCENPRVSLEYIPIDYDSSNEYIRIRYWFFSYFCARFVPFQCSTTRQCGPFSFGSGLFYGNCITIDVGPWVDRQCGIENGILTANVTLTCTGTESPTMEPTLGTVTPTLGPTPPTTLAPSTSPTMSPTMRESELCNTGFNNITYIRPPFISQSQAARLACEAVYGICFSTFCNGQWFYRGYRNSGCSCFKSANEYEWIYASNSNYDVGGFWCNTGRRIERNKPFTRRVSPNLPNFICNRPNCVEYVNDYFTDCITLSPTSLTLPPSYAPTMEPTVGFTETKFVQILRNIGRASVDVCFDVSSCQDPRISIEYLPIDYFYSSNEYIAIRYSFFYFYYCARFTSLSCSNSKECGPFSLGNSLRYGNCITIDVGPWVNNRCGPEYGILTANVTLSCSGTQMPTMEPTLITTEPTISPRIFTTLPPTFEPTLLPTTEPTISTPSPTKSPQVAIMVNWNTNLVGGGFRSNGFVLGGIDFVQYSLNGVPKPALGAKDGNGNFIYTTTYLAGNFAFASQANLDIFLTDPARYAPRYGGYDAFAMSFNSFAIGDPGAWTIYLNELYINASPGARNIWDNDIPGNIARADTNWANRGFAN